MKAAKRVALVLIAVLIARGLWWLAFEPAWYSQLALRYRVSVERHNDATPIESVWFEPFSGSKVNYERILKERILSEGHGRVDPTKAGIEWRRAVIASYHGEPIEVTVVGDSCESTFGIPLAYWQEQHLLVVAELADGRRVGTIVDIPDARTAPREMRVVLP